MKYMRTDDIGRPVAFYSKDVHPVIPPEAIEITDDEWQYVLQNQGRVAWDSEIEGFVEIEPVVNLADLKAEKLMELENGIREKIIKSLIEKDEEYISKREVIEAAKTVEELNEGIPD